MPHLFICMDAARHDPPEVELCRLDAVPFEAPGDCVLIASSKTLSKKLAREAIDALQNEVQVVILSPPGIDTPIRSLPQPMNRQTESLTKVDESFPRVIAIRREFYFSRCATRRATTPTVRELLDLVDSPNEIQFVEMSMQNSDRHFSDAGNRIQKWGLSLLHRFPNSVPLLRFGCVGASGVLVDLSVLAICLSVGVPSELAAVLAIWIAMSWNFQLNRRFTFSGADQSPLLRQYARFCFSCLFGAAVNWSVRVGLLRLGVFAESPYLASLVGIVAGTGFNFCLCNRFVFSRTPSNRGDDLDGKSNSGADDRPGDFEVAQPGPISRDWGQRSGIPQAMIVLATLFGAGWTTFGESNSPVQKTDAPEIPAKHAAPGDLRRGAATERIFQGTSRANPAEKHRSASSVGSKRLTVDEPQLLAEVTPTLRPAIPDKKKEKPPLVLERDFSDAAVEGRLRKASAFLADDQLQGRGVNTYGLDLAADYIGDQFRKCGLDTDHYESGPYQEFRLYSLGSEGAVQQMALLNEKGERTVFTIGTDYTSIMAARAGRVELPIVFAGFGITAPSVSYDDYAGLKAEGAAVIVLRHGPSVVQKGGEALARHTWIRTKIRNAVEHGARAVVFCNDLSEIARVRDELKLDPNKSEPLLRTELTPDTAKDAVPAIHCRRSVLKTFLSQAGFDLDKTEKGILADSRPASRELGQMRISAVVSRARHGRKLRNVLGLLAGKSELAGETIVLGAHYDHLGRGGWGSLALGANQQIHNGADDNASGTSILIEVARKLATRKEPLKRSVLFIAFTGEELGLIGSKRYVRDPLIPLDQTIAMLNLDMVGRLRKDLLTVYGTGTSPIWPPLLGEKSKSLGLQLASRPGGYGPSDHASFYEKGVPVLHFFTGFHPQYHRPSDDAELLNIKGMRRITNLVTELIVEISESKARPVRSRIRSGLANLDPKTLDSVLSGQPARPRHVILGVSPKESRDGKGVVIASTVPRSPAARFGLRVGDVIVRVGGQEVKNSRQLTELVQARKLGDTVPVQIRRNGILLELDIKL